MRKNSSTSAFTLIELSIVLVIIGLIIGGVLAGQALIKASELRALISQIDQFKIATNTFKGKYGQLPGDMSPSKTTQLGFFTFTGATAGGEGAGNHDGLIYTDVDWYCINECGAFWRHLSEADLISGVGAELETDTGTLMHGAPLGENIYTPFTLSAYMPTAKGGFGFVGVSGLLYSYMSDIPNINARQNLFWVQPAANADRDSMAEPSMSAIDSFSIDSKIDDGKPNSGKFIASVYDLFNISYYWSSTVNASSNVCTYGGSDALATDVQYNLNPSTGGNRKTCIPFFLW